MSVTAPACRLGGQAAAVVCAFVGGVATITAAVAQPLGDSSGGFPPIVGAHSQMVTFADPRLKPVRVVRGLPPAAGNASVERKIEIVSFGSGRAQSVTIVRGGSPNATAAVAPAIIGNKRLVSQRIAGVTVMRGRVARDDDFTLFRPADGGELDRLAFAVDGVESRHGADPRMWRDDLSGPQGPMQVSAAAALDVGGGNRFDLRENRMLGRAYLAQMFRRYGNWPDALAAYNWGPGNVDAWVAAGRASEKLPYDVMRYIELVLRDALLGAVRL